MDILQKIKGQLSTPTARSYKPPVSWLLGRQLVAGLRWIAIYSLYGSKFDPKDWMHTKVDETHAKKGRDGTFWFDYIADSGDGQKAVYNVAHLCMSDLYLNANSKEISLAEKKGYDRLPRGEFLFVGGDTAYHIADSATLAERFQKPFNWAYEDLINGAKKIERRPIYGIPGNHDYYDALDGFNRQFLKPINASQPDSPLDLKGFERIQSASYIALKLPFDWWFWGMDTQNGLIDKRQQAFFLSTFGKRMFEDDTFAKLASDVPDKLIVATPEPSTKFGKWAGEGEKIVKSFKSLGLEPSFLERLNGRLPKNKCRLDISGDIHHYARYWGEPAGGVSNYSSVVAGGGGAFLHPTHTDVEEVPHAKLYPNRLDSHRLMLKQLLNPVNIFSGGYVWLAGALLAVLTYFAVTVPESTWSLLKIIPYEFRPCGTTDGCGSENLLARTQVALDTRPFTDAYQGVLGSDQSLSFLVLDFAYVVILIGILIYWAVKMSDFFDEKTLRSDVNHWRRRVIDFLWPLAAAFFPLSLLVIWKRDLVPFPFMASLLVALFVVVAIVTLVICRRYSDALLERDKLYPETQFDLMPLWILMILSATSGSYGFLSYGTFPASIMTFDLMAALVWLIVVIGLTVLAAFIGGHLLDVKGKVWFAVLGLWYAILQVTVPTLLVVYGSFLEITVTIIFVWIASEAARRIFSMERLIGRDETAFNQTMLTRWLLVAWIIVGVVAFASAITGAPQDVTFWRILAAAALGIFFSCIWFGWYVSVALGFRGHNNEGGGGARLERFRHFIRFKLTSDSLTGYVIGIDTPIEDLTAEEPSCELVDVFTIRHSG